MKLKFILLLILWFVCISTIGQTSTQTANKPINEWTKNPSTYIYSLKYENQEKENFFKQYQKKYRANVDIKTVIANLKSTNEEQRSSAIETLGLIPQNDQISTIENLLLNDPSITVRMQCAKSLKYLKSTKSIPLLIKELKTNDSQLKIEIALTLASLGEKSESFKALQELEKIGDWKISLDTHLGYLDLATSDAVKALKSDLLNHNAYVSVDAAIVLSELGYFKEAFSTLKSKLSDQDKSIRICALRGLAYIGNNTAIALIKGSLSDTEPIVRDRAALILKNCKLN